MPTRRRHATSRRRTTLRRQRHATRRRRGRTRRSTGSEATSLVRRRNVAFAISVGARRRNGRGTAFATDGIGREGARASTTSGRFNGNADAKVAFDELGEAEVGIALGKAVDGLGCAYTERRELTERGGHAPPGYASAIRSSSFCIAARSPNSLS